MKQFAFQVNATKEDVIIEILVILNSSARQSQ